MAEKTARPDLEILPTPIRQITYTWQISNRTQASVRTWLNRIQNSKTGRSSCGIFGRGQMKWARATDSFPLASRQFSNLTSLIHQLSITRANPPVRYS